MNSSNCYIDGAAQIFCIIPLVTNIISVVVSLGAVALFVMLLVGGFKFLFAAGDQKKLEGARSAITSAIIGIIVMSLAYLIVSAIGKFTGVNTTIFEFPVL